MGDIFDLIIQIELFLADHALYLVFVPIYCWISLFFNIPLSIFELFLIILYSYLGASYWADDTNS